MKMIIRKTIQDDLETLFKNQRDKEANVMAAFTAEDPNDKVAYMAKWSKIVDNDQVNMQTVLLESQIVGSVLHFSMDGEINVSYWIGKTYWGKGIASQALSLFVHQVSERPLFGRVAFDNIGSQKVLEKCGFEEIGTDVYFANARGKEIEEKIYRLD